MLYCVTAISLVTEMTSETRLKFVKSTLKDCKDAKVEIHQEKLIVSGSISLQFLHTVLYYLHCEKDVIQIRLKVVFFFSNINRKLS